jgi:aminoglycoside phosphotransferase family enzyme/predicted kinase
VPVTNVRGASGDAAPTVVETHSAVLFFVGDRVYKVKKAVDLGFLDHRDLATRKAVCEREVALNRRLAPDVYLGVWDVVGPDGVPSDHLVVMRRMPADRSLARCVRAGEDVDDEIRHIAHALATLHAGEPPSPRAAELASVAAVGRNWHDSFTHLRTLERDAGLDGPTCRRIEGLVDRYLAGREALFRQRITDGWVRDGHGDLMAEDIFLLPDGPRILDCLEFDERYRIGDVVGDAAFLAMDLERLGHPDLARRFLAVYQDMVAARWPPSLAHHLVAYRAHVRAKVGAIRQVQEGRASDDEVAGLLDQCRRHLERGRVRLVLVGGPPGTGKSTVAEGIADALDAVVLRTDEVRRRLPDPPEGRYSPGAKRAVYDEAMREAGRLLGLGHHVVLDGTWDGLDQRTAARDVADDASADLVELECRAPEAVVQARIARRSEMGADPSEVTPEVATALATGFPRWPEATVLDTTEPFPATVRTALVALGWEDEDL